MEDGEGGTVRRDAANARPAVDASVFLLACQPSHYRRRKMTVPFFCSVLPACISVCQSLLFFGILF